MTTTPKKNQSTNSSSSNIDTNHKTTSSSYKNECLVWLFVFSLSILVRYVVSIHPYSGHATPPMFGDYEAQRHWMEITTKLPISQWYFNTTDNNLLYWGLDYPPLTAYSSWLFGKVGELIEPESMALFTSRGYETVSSKLFMRSTVIVSDLFIWLPSVYYFIQSFYKDQSLFRRVIGFIFISMHPSLLLIDHGHFQYNGISLGFALFGITFILQSRQLLGSIFFVLSLNYKQMSLYYSPTFFFFLLFSNLSFRNMFKSILNILKIGIVVILTFLICWIPFLSIEQASQVMFRLFPVARGLYEDKVANFWCVASTVFNFKSKFTPDQLVKLCIMATLAGFVPIIYPLIKKCYASNIVKNSTELNPNKTTNRDQQLIFIYSLIICSFSFFLFSFQVHEKTILLPWLPVSLLILETPYVSWIFGLISTFSMFPLLFKDGLIVPYTVCQFIYIISGYQMVNTLSKCNSLIKKLFTILTLVLVLTSHYLFEFITPPTHLPVLFHLLVASISFGYFCLTVLHSLYRMYSISNSSPTKIKAN